MEIYRLYLLIIVLICIAAMNIYSFVLFYKDKQYAKTNQYRIPEKKLIGASFLLGGIGAYAGMQLFRHKTQHLKFKILMPIAALITISVYGWIVVDIFKYL